MKPLLISLCLISVCSAVMAEDYQPQLFKSVRLVYADDFSGGEIDTDHWQPRQGSTWVVKDGVLVGGPSPKEYQDKKVAAGDKAHAGFKPVMWLEKVPQNLVVQFRVRFDTKDYHSKFPLIDIGHHVNTLNFSAKTTKLTVKKNLKVFTLNENYLPLNKWVDVTIELKEGTMLLSMGGKRHVFEDPNIDMVDQQQIDFKGVDHGGLSIDDVKVYEGIN